MKIDGHTLSHETSETIRRLAVRRVREGERPSAVVKNFGLCRTSIYRWLRAVKHGGREAARLTQGRGPETGTYPETETSGTPLDQRERSAPIRL